MFVLVVHLIDLVIQIMLFVVQVTDLEFNIMKGKLAVFVEHVLHNLLDFICYGQLYFLVCMFLF